MVNRICVGVLRLLLLVSTVCCFTAPPVFSATYYVSNSTGNDTQNGTSSSSAWKTLSKVNSFAFQPGDTVLFKRGDTWSKQQLKINRNGAPGQPITFSAYGIGQRPKFDAAFASSPFYGVFVTGRSWIVVDSLQFYRFGKGIWINGSNNITIKNSLVSHIGGECVRLAKASNKIIMDNNEIHDCGQMSNGEGVYVGTDPLQAQGIPDRTRSITIKNNEIYNIRNEAIELKAGTSDCTVQNNVIRDVDDSARGAIHTSLWVDPLIVPKHKIDFNVISNVRGIGIEIRGADLQITRNIIYNAGRDGIYVHHDKNTEQVPRIYNNTLYNNGGSGLRIAFRAKADDKNNLPWGNGAGNLNFDPLFANPKAADFRLCAGDGFPVASCLADLRLSMLA